MKSFLEICGAFGRFTDAPTTGASPSDSPSTVSPATSPCSKSTSSSICSTISVAPTASPLMSGSIPNGVSFRNTNPLASNKFLMIVLSSLS